MGEKKGRKKWFILGAIVAAFAAFFATYVVLENMTAGGPSGKDVFNMSTVKLETGYLLVSSFTCGMASLGARARSNLDSTQWLWVINGPR
jgi:cytochrome o ubiquinol oxidase subunit III